MSLTQEELEAMLMLDEDIKEALSHKKGFENIKQTLEEETVVKAQMVLFDEEETK